MNWYDYPITVPFGNPNYDVKYGGAHDLDVGTPPNTPITALLPGTIVSVSSPAWGMSIGILLDTPYKSIAYMAYLHLAAVNVKVGQHIHAGDLIAWSGGCTLPEQYHGTSNPTGSNFLDTPDQSSQPQTGIALMRGPVYGEGLGWTPKPDPALDPTPLLEEVRKANVSTPAPTYTQFTEREKQLWTTVERVPLNESFAIPQSWVAALRRTHWFGVPIEPEVNGTQAFTAAYAKWDPKTGKVHWFVHEGEYTF